MNDFARRVIRLFEEIHPLDRIQRAGYVLRGVPDPESVAAHSHFVSLMVLLFVDAFPHRFDRDRAIAMAILHDLSESKLMDIPMPISEAFLREAKDRAEQEITETLFDGFPVRYASLNQEFIDAETQEARLVRGLDKAQMMIKIIMYEREGKGRLKEFWNNPRNFADYGIPEVSALFDAICDAAGRPRPK